ncbi:hypothetical protein C8R46DRAFT_1193072 [Mycena filopes]|nr:hypothetical protein C8R46DRAFT_1193072 [Mycena filopes]
MRYSVSPLAAILAVVVSAQAQITINVGAEQSSPNGGIFQFNPSASTAANGTVVTFLFSGVPGNHSVTQSSFATPCEPLAGGFDSGFIGIGAATTPLPQWNVTITDDSKPIWFFCKQPLPLVHCAAGMVGGINIPTTGDKTFAAFQTNAKAAKSAGQAAGGLVGVGASASAVPLVPSGAIYYGPGASASATAPAGASGSGAPAPSGSAPAASGAPAPSSARVNANAGVFVALLGAIAAGVMVL